MTKKLLLADDSLTIQKVIGIIFANEDYQLLVTDNGDDALEQARKESPDLIMADIGMPGKDGFELCQEIRKTPGLEHTPVMLLPGTFELFDEDRAQAVGANGWLTKPFESQALTAKVEELLAAAPAVSAAPAVEETPAAPAAPAVEELPAEETGDDMWDSISFEEEEPEIELTEDVPVVEEAAASFVEETPFIDEPEPLGDVEEEVLELADNDIFELEDVNVMVGEPQVAAAEESITEMEDFPFETRIEIDKSSSASDDTFVVGGTAAEESSMFIEEPAPLVKEEAPAAAAAGSTDSVEADLRNLSDGDLQAVVERVAGPLIEKLAGEMLERVAWEVVPDLAENMIREEIRKIKEGSA